MAENNYYEPIPVISIGVFMRGVLLGELGFNNLSPKGWLSGIARDLCGGQRGYSLKTFEIGFQPGLVHIADPESGWDVLVKNYESRLLSGDDIQSVLSELTFSNAYLALTSSDREITIGTIQCYSSIFQHLVYFANALAQHMVTQTPH